MKAFVAVLLAIVACANAGFLHGGLYSGLGVYPAATSYAYNHRYHYQPSYYYAAAAPVVRVAAPAPVVTVAAPAPVVVKQTAPVVATVKAVATPVVAAPVVKTIATPVIAAPVVKTIPTVLSSYAPYTTYGYNYGYPYAAGFNYGYGYAPSYYGSYGSYLLKK